MDSILCQDLTVSDVSYEIEEICTVNYADSISSEPAILRSCQRTVYKESLVLLDHVLCFMATVLFPGANRKDPSTFLMAYCY